MATAQTDGPAVGGTVAGRALRLPWWARALAAYLLAGLVLLVAEHVAFAAARVPVTIQLAPNRATFILDGQRLELPLPARADGIALVSGSPLIRELQLDGTDALNNLTEDPAYVASLSASPYYQFQNWMRDSDGYSRWTDLTVRDATSGRLVVRLPSAGNGRLVALPSAHPVVLTASVERLEMPVQAIVFCAARPCAQLDVNRNERAVTVEALGADGSVLSQAHDYFPTQAQPFAAGVVYLIARVALWSLALLGLIVVVGCFVFVSLRAVTPEVARFPPPAHASAAPSPTAPVPDWGAGGQHGLARLRAWLRARRWDRWDAVAATVAFASLVGTCWVALVQFQAAPHILDASAYYFQAKIFASGQLSAPAPINLPAFQGPFMVAHDGRWFAQYPPATSALLALGLVLGVPWLVEPLLGTLALWGIYRLGRRLFSPATGLLALALGALSPFYQYLAASYLSHAVLLFFSVYFLLFLFQFVRDYRAPSLMLAAACAGGMLLTRELDAVLIGMVACAYTAVVYRKTLWQRRSHLLEALLGALAVTLLSLAAYLGYNLAQTGDALLLPRTLFSPADQYGFGAGIGFYGRHTLAAGLVNLDQQLTSLLIDLYGWPFYLTLAFLPLAFLPWRRTHVWDGFCLLMAGLIVLAQIGYFYHGIYLGPRYLYAALPFLLLLTARGITGAYELVRAGLRRWTGSAPQTLARYAAGVGVSAALAGLLACNVGYYLPRQVQVHADFTGLPAALPLDADAVYAFHPSHAVVVTDNWLVYSYVTWPLNDPDLRGSTLYAYAPDAIALSRLWEEFPGRSFYRVTIRDNGSVMFLRLNP
jgi:4-amino-4-deoxy-L-arabinose transferase-like glycosyltransferase